MVFSKRLRGFWWNRSFRRWVVMSLLLYKASIGLVAAEQTEFRAILTYQEYALCEWLPDNTLQITDKPNYFDQGATRFVYDPQTEVLTSQGGLSFPYSFLTPMSRVLPPVYSQTAQDSDVFASPDGRFVIYALAVSSEADRPYTKLILLDRKTWRSTVISDLRVHAFNTYIRWNLGSKSFIITEEGSYGSDPTMTYVNGFEDDPEQMRVTQISGYSEMADAFQWSLYQVHDIDSTGQYILAEGYFYQSEDERGYTRLIVINMHDLSYELVAKGRYFITGRFEQPGDKRVFYLNSTGLFSFDRETKTQETLNNNIQDIATWTWGYSRTCQPTISPDGHFIAFDDDDETNEVIVLPIKEP